MSLEFRHIAHAYGRHQALADIDLVAPAEGITCLLGSSGCGKTTLLNLTAGLLPVQQGSIHLGDTLLADATTHPPPEKRPVGLVFQEGALFPHLTIAENIAFGLAKGGRREAEVTKWLDRIGLAGFADRYPNSLSGGQQQRVALARAMAPRPALLLMDEPFANVDIVLRRSLRRESRRLLKEQGAAAILVTHDPEEAVDIGDRIAVMDAGRIVQADTPEALYDRPASAAVGAMFGDAQILAARREGDMLATPFGDWPLSCLANDPPGEAELDLLVRTTALRFEANAAGASIEDIRRSGPLQRVTLGAADGERLALLCTPDQPAALADRVSAIPLDRSIFAFSRSPK